MKRTWLALAALGCPSPPEPPDPPEPPLDHGVVLVELMASNTAAWPDPDATCDEFDDWVEILNLGPDAADLSGWTLADDPADTSPWAFPDIQLEVGGRLVLVADDQPEQGPLHTTFKLSAEGESLILRDAEGEVVDAVDFPVQATDRSWGRTADSAAEWTLQPRATPGEPNPTLPDDPCFVAPTGFDDHTVSCLGTLEGFDAIARTRASLRTVKFDVLAFSDPANRRMAFLDSAFYDLHDEWYIFRMLNGQLVEGETDYDPWFGNTFATIDDIYTWAAATDIEALFDPQFITWAGKRLTSRRYYELALNIEPRVIGAGVLVHAPPVEGRDEYWGFELEYGDDLTHDQLVVYFETMAAALPAEIADGLVWFTRSAAQARLGERMADEGLAYADRVVDYAALSVPGAVEVYHQGITAGRVRMIRTGEGGLEVATATDLLVLDEVPDELPQAAALLTAVPQTPLAHVALLAESRDIPNAHVAGITADPRWDQWARVRAWVAMRADADGVDAVALGPVQIGQWNSLQRSPAPTLPTTTPLTEPLTVDLTATSAQDAAALRPVIGGKSAGLLPLLDIGAEVPDAPLALSIRGYAEHAAAVGLLDAVLDDPAFATPGDPRTRYLILEGRSAFSERYALPRDQSFLTTWAEEHPEGDVLGDLVRAGGVRGAFEQTDVPATVLDPLLAQLQSRFGHLDPTQGLRFRSSSNVEDIEGFNGAGLYASHTGWLQPGADQASIADALRRTWASYWGAEAFEERHNAGIDHRGGAMGVLIHPRFDDVYELSNGVITVRRIPAGDAARYEVVFNNQLGEISVTNPPVDGTCTLVLPEVVRLTADADGAWQIERLQASTETAGAPVLVDATLTGVADTTRALADRWLELDNAELEPDTQRQTVTVDLEYREMSGDWPARLDGRTTDDRVVLKQARSLEPSVGHLPESVVGLEFPRDLLARARTVTRVRCETDAFDLDVVQLRTDPLKVPDLGYTSTPFIGVVRIDTLQPIPELGLGVAERIRITHLDLDIQQVDTSPVWLLDTAVRSTPSLVRLTLESEGTWSLQGPGGTATGVSAACETEPLFASPDTFLEEILDSASP